MRTASTQKKSKVPPKRPSRSFNATKACSFCGEEINEKTFKDDWEENEFLESIKSNSKNRKAAEIFDQKSN